MSIQDLSIDELRDQNLRLIAEVQNFRRRSQKEQEDTRRFAEEKLILDVLVILDDIKRVNDHDPHVGVSLVYEKFLSILNQYGVYPIQSVGQEFDPDVHEAISVQCNDKYPKGTVIEEQSCGYRMYERVLRPCKVIVSGGAN